MTTRRLIITIAAVAVVAVLYALTLWCVGDRIATRDIWVPRVYAIAMAGLFVAAAMLVVLRGREAVLWASAVAVVSQSIAILAVILRQPGHALAAQQLFLAVQGGAFFVAIWTVDQQPLPGRVDTWMNGARVLALLMIAAAPPLPGFFARVDVFSALMHADLPRLAVAVAIAQVAVFMRMVGMALEPRGGHEVIRETAANPPTTASS
ncbi:MAG: hypothetical protein H6684_04430 [Deltaproteobacteria bacterium]|nr:hypothetical protein [Deltaproteobacteria bacterium]